MCYVIFRRLQLARYEWTMFLDEDEYDVNMELLTSRMKNKLATMKKEESSASCKSVMHIIYFYKYLHVPWSWLHDSIL